ncbi:MAG: hypothetical protein LBC41_18010 [Clostridiales bacterium]|jgi:hypothetical protein|nr:hypothetical protein [Clostridiales bacterium]
MPTPALLKALTALVTRSVPSASVLTAAFIIISLGGLLYTVNALLGYKKSRIGIALLAIAFVALGTIGIFAPLMASGLLNMDESRASLILSDIGLDAGALPAEIYQEALFLSIAFAAVSALYINRSQRMLERGRSLRQMLVSVLCSSGIEAVAAVGVALACAAKLGGLALNLNIHLLFYAIAIIGFKLAEQLFVIVYAYAFGAVSLGTGLDCVDLADAGFDDLKELLRKQCGVASIPLFLLGLAGFTALAPSVPGGQILHLLLLFLLAMLAVKAAWFIMPDLHPLSREISRRQDPDAVARQLLKERKSPLFHEGNVVATASFLIHEALSVKAFALCDLVMIERRGGGSGLLEKTCALCFKNGKRLVISAEHAKILEYAAHWLRENRENLR